MLLPFQITQQNNTTNAAPFPLDLKREGWQGLDWFRQDHLMAKWLAVVNTLMNIQLP
jgi:hypothetical protein